MYSPKSIDVFMEKHGIERITDSMFVYKDQLFKGMDIREVVKQYIQLSLICSFDVYLENTACDCTNINEMFYVNGGSYV